VRVATTIPPVTEPGPDGAAEEGVLCRWDVPGAGAYAPVHIVARAGRSTTVVGANGSGKSALGLWMEQNSGGFSGIRRLIAHRKLWFQHAGPEITSAQREQTRGNVIAWSRQHESRYLDHADGQRASLVLFDILARVNHENAQMLKVYRTGASHQEVEAQFRPPLLDRLNAIFRAAGLVIELMLTDAQTLNAVNSTSGTEYPIFQMSDGEKSALLLAGEVLTTPTGSVYIIDEPERHLHRSISAGLVEAIIADRPDSHFVVLTHDLELAAALGGGAGQICSLTRCTWTGQGADGWELFPVDASAEIPESARLAILGGRRELLFIEGETHSLDLRLYRLLFPNWTLFPTGGCDQVIRAVTGLRTSQSHHWLNARGVADGDWRTEDEKSSLHARGILALPVSEVENLYYSDRSRLRPSKLSPAGCGTCSPWWNASG
jgi:energy-coupling factor transporter ATP-binding protein EcfA2